MKSTSARNDRNANNGAFQDGQNAELELVTTPSPGVIKIIVDGNERAITASELQSENEAARQEIFEFCKSGASAAIFVLNNLLDLEDDSCWHLLNLIETVAGVAVIIVNGQPRRFQDPFYAVLELLEGSGNVERCLRGKYAATATAAIFYPNGLEIACNSIAKRFKQLGVPEIKYKELFSMATEIMAGMWDNAAADEICMTSVNDAIDSDLAAAEACVPDKWELSRAGISLRQQDKRKLPEIISPTPVLILRRFKNSASGQELLELAWLRDGIWQKKKVERGLCASSREIVKLSEFGFPVTSNTATNMVQYLADYEAKNMEVLPVIIASQQMGWQGEEGFLWGKEFITPPEAAPEVEDEIDYADDLLEEECPATGAKTVVFHGADGGDDQLAEGFRDEGKFEDWKSVASKMQPYPRVLLAAYASLAAPLLRLFGAQNFVLDYSGQTSSGKTTTLRFSASVWGNPDEKSPDAAISTWDSTRVARERGMATLCDLPAIYDDTKRAKKTEEVTQALYDAVSGRGRQRGTLKGTARVDTFHTIFITNGEAPATSFSEDGGTRARTLALWGGPFGDVNEETGRILQELNEVILENYGHAGPRLIQYLLENRPQWDDWRAEFRQLREAYAARDVHNAVANRMAGSFAAIAMAAKLAHAAGILSWPYSDPITPLWDELVHEAKEADRAAAALQHVMSWARGHQQEFFPGRENRGIPHNGWAGRWDLAINAPLFPQQGNSTREEEAESAWQWIGFFPDRLQRILEERDFEFEPTIRMWSERGWLHTTSSGNKSRFKARVANEPSWLIAIKHSAVLAVEEGEHSPCSLEAPSETEDQEDPEDLPRPDWDDSADPSLVQISIGIAV